MTDHEKRIRERLCLADEGEELISVVASRDLRALLADLDAVRGALEGCVSTLWGLSPALTDDGCYTDDPKEQAARAALSAAKDGGWVAVPQVPTPQMIAAAIRECGGIGGGSCGEHTGVDGSDFQWVWETMLAARPLPNPPKEQA